MFGFHAGKAVRVRRIACLRSTRKRGHTHKQTLSSFSRDSRHVSVGDPAECISSCAPTELNRCSGSEIQRGPGRADTAAPRRVLAGKTLRARIYSDMRDSSPMSAVVGRTTTSGRASTPYVWSALRHNSLTRRFSASAHRLTTTSCCCCRSFNNLRFLRGRAGSSRATCPSRARPPSACHECVSGTE